MLDNNRSNVGFYFVCIKFYEFELPKITLTNCITNCSSDISVDAYRHSVIPVLRQFGLYDRDEVKFELKILKRGSAPLGGGEVYLTVPNPKKLRAVVSLGENSMQVN